MVYNIKDILEYCSEGKPTKIQIDVKTEEEDAKANSFSSNLADKLSENDFVLDDFDFDV